MTGEPEVVRVRMLGGFDVSVGRRAVEGGGWRLRKSASLVKLLALAEGHALHRERITAALWPELGAKPATNHLHRALHFARKAFEPANAAVASRYLALRSDL